MELLPRSTSARLALAVSISFLFGFVLLGVGVYLTVSTLLLESTRELVRADAAGLVQVWHDSGRNGFAAEISDRADDADDPNAVYLWVPLHGKPVGSYDAMPVNSNGPKWVQYMDTDDDGHHQRVVAELLRLPDGSTLLVGQHRDAQDRFLRLMQDAALAALLVAVLLGALVGWLTSLWVSRRLRALDRTAARVGAGELALRVPLDGSDDSFDRLAWRFNAMLDRIEELLDGVRHATDHIAHDLRTPLTRLRNRLDELRRRHRDASEDDVDRTALDAAVSETDKLLQAFGALLRLSRIESSKRAQDEPVIALDEVVADAVELYTPSAAERGIHVAADLAPCKLRGDRDQLFQLTVNLLDNALKYAPEHSVVGVSLQADGEHVVLQVDDAGAGIPEADRERVFDRFQRLEAHRGSPGIGLGLSLVRAIARRHGGRVALLDRHPGLRVRVLLPPA